MAAMRPRAAFAVPDTLDGRSTSPTDITFRCIADFLPAAVARQVEPLRNLLEARLQLASAARGGESKTDAAGNGRAGADGASATSAPTTLTSVRPGAENVSAAHPTAATAVGETVAEIDRRMSEQLSLILHADEFQRLEGTWRGLHHLVSRTETDESLKICVLNISKSELARTLRMYKGVAWDQSAIFRIIVRNEYGRLGGTPFGCLLGDYYFDRSERDVELLSEMAKVAAAAHAPFIAGAAPTVLQMVSWQELHNPRKSRQDIHRCRLCRMELITELRQRALHRSRHAAFPLALAI
jgi:predicted component of type VI protein secretion system